MTHLNRSALPNNPLDGEHLKALRYRTFEEVTIHWEE